MTKYKPVLAVAVTCMLIAFAGSAKSDIVQCIDSEGAVSFTDLSCVSGSQKLAVAPFKSLPVPLVQASASPVKATLKSTGLELQVKNNAGARTFAVDATTMSAAKASMVSLDLASDLARQQALADKAMRSGSWAFWRS